MERHRYAFPADWVYVENLQGAWSAFQDIYQRKSQAINSQVRMTSMCGVPNSNRLTLTLCLRSSLCVQLGRLQEKIVAEDRRVTERIDLYRADWEAQKPLDGTSFVPRV